MIEPLPASDPCAEDRPAGGDVARPTAAQFADAYAARVHRFAAMVTRNDQDSADLAQEALLKALRGLARFQPGAGTLDAWVWRIVINTARDAGRLRTRRSLLTDRWFREHHVSGGECSIEDEAIHRLRDAEILEAVRRLPERPRTIIALRYGAQLGTGEIATHLRMTPPAVSMATGRALSRLRRQLEEMP
ncbi:MAG: RNA polymerase sigma factor [Solirubrobacteraceae bacterium]